MTIEVPKLNRRDFLKSAAALLGTALVAPSLFFEGQAFEPIKAILQDGWTEALKFEKIEQSETGQFGAVYTMDTSVLWDHVKIMDEGGRVWRTPDEGETWLPDGYYGVNGEVIGTFSYSEV